MQQRCNLVSFDFREYRASVVAFHAQVNEVNQLKFSGDKISMV